MRSFWRLAGCVAVAGGLLAGGGARAAQEAEEDGAELLNLLSILEEQTEIATKTKLNADYVPGMVTVLQGDELEARGVATVWQALGLVPGMELSMDRFGQDFTMVRGIGVSGLTGKLKILLDDVTMNSSFDAMGLPVLEMPVEQVERIEVIRGPGSAIHGEFAYLGVVNVITRKEGRGAHLRVGSHGSRQAGAHAGWESASGELKLSTNVVVEESDGEGVFVTSDALSVLQGGVSNAPGTTDEPRGYGAALFDLRYRDFTLIAQWLREERGSYFGSLNVLPGDDAAEVAGATSFVNLEARYRMELADEAELMLRGGWQQYRYDSDISHVPPGYLFVIPGVISLPYVDGWNERGRIGERRGYGGADLSWKMGDRHTLLAALSAARVKVDESWLVGNVDPGRLLPLPAPTRFENRVPLGYTRDIASLTLQDEFRATDDVGFTFGLRYDDYNDFGESLSPRVAAVWRIDHGNILKAQYAEAFRPPTLFEMTRSPTVQPETIRSVELGYVHRFAEGVGRVTLFQSKLNDLIYEDNLARYYNAPGVRSRGVEFELERQLGNAFKLNANLSLADTEDERTGEQSTFAAQQLFNVGLIYQPVSDRMVSLQWRYVGDRAREAGDTRGDLDGYQTLDLTGTIHDPFGDGVTLRLGVNNLLDEDVRYPAGLVAHSNGALLPSYADDYPRPGRYWWAQLSARF